MSLAAYCDQFARLTRAPNRIFTELTKHRAPHKPLLLLAVMDMVERGLITRNSISITGELMELTQLFTRYWRKLLPVTQTSSIAFPFSRMNSEPFWKLIPVPGRQITPEAVNNISTVLQLRRLAIGATLDDELFILMTQPENRVRLTLVLLDSYFSAEGRRMLSEEIDVQKRAYRYSLELEQQVLEIKSQDSLIGLPESVRSQGFRRAVVNCYDHRCALCGVRIITPEGHTVVEAAHIKPWKQYKDDEVPNGMALCRLCHWAFDEGMMSVDNDYHVLISRQVWLSPNSAGFLLTLSNRPIHRPAKEAFWPDLSRLGWHRHKIGKDLVAHL